MNPTPLTRWDDADEFTLTYMHTLLGAAHDESAPRGGEYLDTNYGPEDFSPEALAKIGADCNAFQTRAALLLALPEAVKCAPGATQLQMAGGDFALTRQETGAGFQDGDWLDGVGEQLAAFCGWQKAFPNIDVYVGDDDQVHLM